MDLDVRRDGISRASIDDLLKEPSEPKLYHLLDLVARDSVRALSAALDDIPSQSLAMIGDLLQSVSDLEIFALTWGY